MTSMTERRLGKQCKNMSSYAIEDDFMNTWCEFDLYDCLEFSSDDMGKREETGS